MIRLLLAISVLLTININSEVSFAEETLSSVQKYNFQQMFYFSNQASGFQRQAFQKQPYGWGPVPRWGPRPNNGPYPMVAPNMTNSTQVQNLNQNAMLWNSKDMTKVQDAFSRLLEHEELEPIFNRISQLGKLPIKRYKKYPFPKPPGMQSCERRDKEKKGAALIWVSMQYPFYIGVADEYFELYDKDTTESDGELVTHISLHELMHLLDMQMRHITRSPQFLQQTGWYLASQNGWHQNSPPEFKNRYINYEELNNTHDDFCNDSDETKETAKALAEKAKSFGFPSMYSTINPQEFFAESAATYLLNPKADEILHQDFIAYFDQLFQ